jgi:DNA invertase Pin-like site-specific DNA recombinase
MIRERVMAGLDRARAKGTVLGRRKSDKEPQIRESLAAGGMGVIKIATTVGCGVSVVQCIKAEMAEERAAA